ncbi:MAG: 50S ribosomal protein L6 [Eubacteriales bacterium]
MSRIGRKAIQVPAGVEVTLAADNVVTVKGPKGTLTRQFHPNMTIEKNGAELTVSRPDDEKFNKSLHGLTRTLLNNMVVGVTEGFSKRLEINGVGYRAAKSGKNLQLSLGYSHGVTVEECDGITFEVPDSSTIIVKGIDKQKVGEVAAIVRRKRPPEPYKGKGIKYADEHIRRKAGKTGKSGK